MIPVERLSTRLAHGNAKSSSLGTLSVHLDGAPCPVGCTFCYLGARRDGAATLDPGLIEAALATLRYDELAIAVSEPLAGTEPLIATLVTAARRRSIPTTLTTTLSLARHAPALLDGVARLSLSVDPEKGAVEPRRIAELTQRLKDRAPDRELILIASLSSPEFAARLVEDRLLEALVDLPSVDRVSLNALKPPPEWCDRSFWLRTLAALAPLLARALDRRLFLDCYVAARLLGLGGCPARADLAPAAGGLAFRGCVYQPTPDFVAADAETLAARLASFTAPARCPFPIR